MCSSFEELRLRDIAIGLKAELNEAHYQLSKSEILNEQLQSELISLQQSRTWRIGSLVLAPVRWIKRSKR
jgi:hypothetical protein